MSNTQPAVAQTGRRSLVEKFASTYGVEAGRMLSTLTATAFRQSGNNVISNEQMMALLVVADQYHLNPFTKEIYAFPDKGGIVPIVGVDGWSRIINENPNFDGIEFEDEDGESCTCTIYRKDRTHPTKVTEYLSECRRNTGPWQSHPRRMLRHKAMMQCARVAFAYTGIYDQDEAERIIEGETIRDNEPQHYEHPRSRAEAEVESVQANEDADHLASSAPMTQGHIQLLEAKLQAAKMTSEAMFEAFGVEGWEGLTAGQVNDCLEWVAGA